MASSRGLRRFLSEAEAEDLAVGCDLADGYKLVLVTRRAKHRGDASEESAVLVRRSRSPHRNDGGDIEGEEDEEETILAIAVVSTLTYKFVGNGIFSISPGGVKSDEVFFFQTASLHDLWAILTVLEDALDFAKVEIISTADSHDEWIQGYFHNGANRTSPFVWESEQNMRHHFSFIREVTPPVVAKNAKWSKPDLDELKHAISDFIRNAPDPDDVAESDVINHLQQLFGRTIVSKYGYPKPDVQRWTYTYYGQLERPSMIDEKLYLGSEYNAANLKELQSLGVTHILNVTCEVDKFFPGDFSYHQVPVLDLPSVNLLPYFTRALSFMEAGKKNGAVFVHCQRGVSRSATFVIAHLMETQRMQLTDALKYVKERRRIVKPNTGFVEQLKTWEKSVEERAYAMDVAFTRKSVSEIRKTHEARSTPSPKEADNHSKSKGKHAKKNMDIQASTSEQDDVHPETVEEIRPETEDTQSGGDIDPQAEPLADESREIDDTGIEIKHTGLEIVDTDIDDPIIVIRTIRYSVLEVIQAA